MGPASEPGDGDRGRGKPKIPLRRRYVVLGASNIALGFPRLVESLNSSAGEPFDFLGAFGHGRSFGLASRVLGRALPAILDCDLWRFLESSQAGLPTAPPPVPPESFAPNAAEGFAAGPLKALVTDVGNDLLYGPSVESICGWVEECLRRLQALGAETTLMVLPSASLEALPAWRYHLFRSVLYRRCKKPWPVMQGEIRHLNGELRQLAEGFGARLLEPEAAWYGFDPIHIRPRAQAEAWRKILQAWTGAEAIVPFWRSRPWHWWRLPPARRVLWGRDQENAQPCRQGADGGGIYLA